MPVHGLEKAIMFAQGGMRLAHFAATKKRGGFAAVDSNGNSSRGSELASRRYHDSSCSCPAVKDW